MYKIQFDNKTCHCRETETLLQAFLRQGVMLPFSCQKGSCHVCMLQCTQGEIPAKSQLGLRASYVNRQYFLPCQCQPVSDMVIEKIEKQDLYVSAFVYKKELLSENVCRLLIDCDKLSEYKAGQFINLCRPTDGLARSYSLASYPEQDYYLELHIKRMKNGAFSNWVFDELQEQDAIELQGPMGECHYQPETQEFPMLMIAGGTGLAPLLGILRQALAENHHAEIHLYHQVGVIEDLYLQDELNALVAEHENLLYFPCVPGYQGEQKVSTETVLHLVDSCYADLRDWYVYLAGSMGLVEEVSQQVINSGALAERVFADPFDVKELREKPRSKAAQSTDNSSETSACPMASLSEADYPPPDPELWAALDEGKKLYKILDEFYTIVYEDSRLSPFFQRVTKQRSIEKVYLFLRQVFSGEKVYFGDRPRNAHHWMVISDDLFDYRENIMMTCLRNNGLPEHLIQRWRVMEESFRPDIVKQQAWNKVMNGVELPVEGYDEMTLDSGSLCDSCHEPIESGTRVRYHLRLGSIYCPSCASHDLQDSGS